MCTDTYTHTLRQMNPYMHTQTQTDVSSRTKKLSMHMCIDTPYNTHAHTHTRTHTRTHTQHHFKTEKENKKRDQNVKSHPLKRGSGGREEQSHSEKERSV